jgi:hypothetical protein
MRRTALALFASAAVIVGFVMASGGTAAAPAPSAHGFTLTGSVAGGVREAQGDQPLSFVFSEKNTGSTSQSEDLVLESHTHASLVGIGCILPNGFQINPDGASCEPGFIAHGQTASAVFDTTTASSGSSVTARVCLSNEGSGVVGPCETLTVPLA